MPETLQIIDDAKTETLEESKAKFDAQVYEPNLATDPELAEQARSDIERALEWVEASIQAIHRRMWASDRLYRGDTYGRRAMRSGTVHIPEPWKAVETLTANIVKSLSFRDWFTLADDKGLNPEGARRTAALLRDQVEKARFRQKLEPFVRDSLIRGTGPVKVIPRRIVRKMKVRKRTVVQEDFASARRVIQVGEPQEKEVVVTQNEFTPFDVFDLRWPFNSDGVEEALWIGDYSYPVFDELLWMEELGWYANVSGLKDLPGDAAPTVDNPYKAYAQFAAGVYDPRAGRPPHIKVFRVFDWWGLWHPRRGARGPLVKQEEPGDIYNITLARPEGGNAGREAGNRTMVLQIRRHPYWGRKKPYVVYRPIRKQGEAYGIGIVETISTLSAALDDHAAVALEGALLAASPPMRMTDAVEIDEDQLILEPGTILRTPDVGAIEPITIPDKTDVAYKAASWLQVNIRETSGALSPIQGTQEPGGADTATEFMRRFTAANIRVERLLDNLEIDVLEPMLVLFGDYNEQFLTTEQRVRSAGPSALHDADWVTVKPEHLPEEPRYVLLAARNYVQHVTANQQLLNFLDRAAVLNVQQPGLIKIDRLVERILRDGFGFTDASEFLDRPVSPEEMLTPWDEHKLFAMGRGQDVRVQRGENLIHHYQEHRTIWEESGGNAPPQWESDQWDLFTKHLLLTGEALARMFQSMQQMGIQAPGMPGGPQTAGGGQAGYAGAPPQGRSPLFRPPGMPGYRPTGANGNQERSVAASNEPNLGAS